MMKMTPKIYSEVSHYLSSVDELGSRRQFNKGELICRVGDKPTHLFYMTRGLVKCFYLAEGKEILLRLLTDNSAVLAYSGFITDSPSSEYIECLTDCEGIWLPIQSLENMRSDNPGIDIIFRYMAEQHYLSMERRLMMLQHKTSEDRYRYFCKTMESNIVESTPMHCIASYLGITPESFSRMKRNLIK